MKRTLYILTKHHTNRDSALDEFVHEWGFINTLDEVHLECDNCKVVFIHGCNERFREGATNPKENAFLEKIDNTVQTLVESSRKTEKGFLCHARKPHLPLHNILHGFVFRKTYSIQASSGEWEVMSALKGTFDPTTETPEITNPDNFIEAFNRIWACFKPDAALLKKLTDVHQAFSESLYPLSISQEKVASKAKREVAICTYTQHHERQLQAQKEAEVKTKTKVKTEDKKNISKTSNQTEHYIVIWNGLSCDWFCRQLQAHFLSQKDTIRPARILTVISQAEFETVDWSKKYEMVFLLAECFSIDLSFEGLSLARTIIEKRGNSLPLKLLTCSVISRKDLHNEASLTRHRRIINYFQHLALPQGADTTLSFSELDQVTMTKTKWQSKFYEFTNDYQILDIIRHNLENLLVGGEPEFSDELASKYIKELFDLRALLKEETRQLLQTFNTCIKNRQSYSDKDKHLRSLLNALMQEIKEGNAELEEDMTSVDKKVAHIMIVEDDKMTAKQIKAHCLDYFKEDKYKGIVIFPTGAAARAELEANRRKYDALIVDLTLLNTEGLEDFVQGEDLIDFCQNSCSHIAIRVVTRLSPSSIVKRLPTFSSDKVVRKRYNTLNKKDDLVWHYGERVFFETLIDEISVLKKHADSLQGPKKGKFGNTNDDSPRLTEYYYELEKNQKDYFETVVNTAIANAKNFLDNPKENPLDIKLGRTSNQALDGKDTSAKWHQILDKLLALRLVFLGRQQENSVWIKYGPENVDDEDGLFFDLNLKLNVDGKVPSSRLNPYFNETLGFDIKWKTPHESSYLRVSRKSNVLFPHELEFLRTVKSRHKAIPLSKYWRESLCNDLLSIAETFKAQFDIQELGEIGRFLVIFIELPTFESLVDLLNILPDEGTGQQRFVDFKKKITQLIDEASDNDLESVDEEGKFFSTPELQDILDDMFNK